MNPESIITPSPITDLAPAETAATALAAQVKATVEARYTIAVHRPRSWDEVRVRILTACRRPSFAHNKSVLYKKPVGSGVEGLGIRFVEEAMRCMGNIMPESMIVYDDPSRRILRVTVTDLEANLTYSQDIVLIKTVERSKPNSDGTYVSIRQNSQGKTVYTVLATEDEFQNKEAAARSKAIRSLGLRMIPGDIADEAEDIIRAIRRDRAAQDPAGERKRIADAFAGLNITPGALEDYLGHTLALCTPSDLVDLRGLYGALRDGETTWSSVMEEKRQEEKRQEEIGGNGTTVTPPTNSVAIALMNAIASATTLSELEAVKPDIAMMKGTIDRTLVKMAYKERKAALQAAQSAPLELPAAAEPSLENGYISAGLPNEHAPATIEITDAKEVTHGP